MEILISLYCKVDSESNNGGMKTFKSIKFQKNGQLLQKMIFYLYSGSDGDIDGQTNIGETYPS